MCASSNPVTRSCTSICLALSDDVPLDAAALAAAPKHIAQRLDDVGVAYDIGAYRDAPPGLRIWGGATVESADMAALTPWLDWAYAEIFETAAAD